MPDLHWGGGTEGTVAGDSLGLELAVLGIEFSIWWKAVHLG
jgi:hypothetical protein